MIIHRYWYLEYSFSLFIILETIIRNSDRFEHWVTFSINRRLYKTIENFDILCLRLLRKASYLMILNSTDYSSTMTWNRRSDFYNTRDNKTLKCYFDINWILNMCYANDNVCKIIAKGYKNHLSIQSVN